MDTRYRYWIGLILPYVAAFFAYRGISNKKAAAAGASEKVRIYVFDQEQWRTDLNQILFS